MPEPHAVYVGPIRADITLDDGTVVDVRPDVVYVDTHEQALELADKVSRQYVEHGHPHHDTGHGFVYEQGEN